MPMNGTKKRTKTSAKKENIVVEIQYATEITELPTKQQFRKWVGATLSDHRDQAELTIRIVDEKEGAMLNDQWRKSPGPTNVLSFPYEDTENKYALGLLGDIIICAPVVVQEALEQGKPLESHWAHMVVHGTLHLLGYDHIKADELERMETLEIKILEHLGYDDPYKYVDNI